MCQLLDTKGGGVLRRGRDCNLVLVTEDIAYTVHMAVSLLQLVILISYTERPRADFVLAFWNIYKNIKIIDKNIISGEKYRIFKLRHLKEVIYIFQVFSHFKHLGAISLQTQQGHFHHWPF
jgi:hypothetical protein